MPQESSKKTQSSINERLNFLIKSLNMSARAFSAAIGVPDSNTRNYLSKGTKVNADYLESIAIHFSRVNLSWLITGEGEPLLSPSSENEQLTRHEQKIFRSSIAGTNNGIGYQEQAISSISAPELQTKLTLAEKEIEHLRTLLAAKDQTIQILLNQQSKP